MSLSCISAVLIIFQKKYQKYNGLRQYSKIQLRKEILSLGLLQHIKEDTQDKKEEKQTKNVERLKY